MRQWEPESASYVMTFSALSKDRASPSGAARKLSKTAGGTRRALLESNHAQLLPFDHKQHDRVLADLRAQLDAATFDAAWAEGQALTLDHAISYTLDNI